MAKTKASLLFYLQQPILTIMLFRVVNILYKWVICDDFDTSLGSELQGFINRDILADPGFARSREVEVMLTRLEHISANIPGGGLGLNVSDESSV